MLLSLRTPKFCDFQVHGLDVLEAKPPVKRVAVRGRLQPVHLALSVGELVAPGEQFGSSPKTLAR